MIDLSYGVCMEREVEVYGENKLQGRLVDA